MPMRDRKFLLAGSSCQRMALVGTVVATHAFGIPADLTGQDTHHWTQQYGTRSIFLGGAVIGSVTDGGPSEWIGTLDSASGEMQHVWPDALPNGRGISSGCYDHTVCTLSMGGASCVVSSC